MLLHASFIVFHFTCTAGLSRISIGFRSGILRGHKLEVVISAEDGPSLPKNNNTGFSLSRLLVTLSYRSHGTRFLPVQCTVYIFVSRLLLYAKTGPGHPWGRWGWSLRARVLISGPDRPVLQNFPPLWAPKFLWRKTAILRGPAVAVKPQSPGDHDPNSAQKTICEQNYRTEQCDNYTLRLFRSVT